MADDFASVEPDVLEVGVLEDIEFRVRLWTTEK